MMPVMVTNACQMFQTCSIIASTVAGDTEPILLPMLPLYEHDT
jgi:hypothetical protein